MKLPVVSKKILLALFVTLFLVLAGLPSYYFYSKYKDAQFHLQNPTAATQEDAKLVVQKVAALMMLPTNEDPTLATVSDSSKLKDQPFFANAVNGDRVLIYTKAKKAILYRPATNKIIDVAPVSFGQNETATASSQAGATTKIALYNGTAVVGLTKKYETELKAKVANAEVVNRDDAKEKPYVTTVIVDVQGTKSVQVQDIAKTLGITVASLPAGEATPAADFLIILGADKK